jgi:hypothetical protein
MRKYEVIYKNQFGRYNILITRGFGKKSIAEVKDSWELYDSHIWINDNIVVKDHSKEQIFGTDKILTDDDLIELFGNVL